MHIFRVLTWVFINMDSNLFLIHGHCYNLTNDTTKNCKFNIIEWICVCHGHENYEDEKGLSRYVNTKKNYGKSWSKLNSKHKT